MVSSCSSFVCVLLFAVLLSVAVRDVGSQQGGGGDITAVATGANVTLTCGTPTSTVYDSVSWIKDSSVSVSTLNDSRLVVSTNHLTITQFHSSEHAGSYSCLLEEEGGAGSYLTCPVHVTHASIHAGGFIVDPQATTVPAGYLTVLHCHPPHSIPAPVISWKRDGLTLNPSLDTRLAIMPSGNLYISNTTHEDSGSYQCVATNPVTGAKRRSQEALLAVTDEVLSNTTQQMFLVSPLNTTASEGDVVVLECTGQGAPPPTVEWGKLYSREFPQTATVLENGALVFDPVTSSDAGRYRCSLLNEQGGMVVHADVDLEVKVSPRIQADLPDYLSLAVGHSSVLTCEFSGSTPLSVSLYHNGQLLTSQVGEDLPYVTLTHTLSPEHERESGVYQCVAENEIGCVQTRADITVLAPAPTESPVTDVSTESPVTNAYSQSPVTDASTQSPITEVSTQSPVTTPVSGGSGDVLPLPELVVTPHVLILVDDRGTLTCSSSQPLDRFQWRAVSEGEDSGFLSPLFGTLTASYLLVTTPGVYVCIGTYDSTTIFSNEVIVRAPLDIMVSADLIEVEAQHPVEIHCKVTGAALTDLVEWTNQDDEALPNQEILRMDDGSVLVVLSLEPAVSGVFTCLVTSSEMERLISADVTVSVINELPNTLRNVTYKVIAGNFLLFQWQPPEDEDGVLGYKVNYDPTCRVKQSARFSIPPSKTSYAVPLYDITPLASYTILLWAYNRMGDGPAYILHLEDLNITSLTCNATVISLDTISLSWKGAISGDVIEVGGCTKTSTVTVTTATGSHDFNGLLPNCTYSFERQSLTDTLCSATTPQSLTDTLCSATTPAGEVDIDIEMERFANGSVKLFWTLPMTLEGSEVSLNWGDGWRPVESAGRHLAAHFKPEREYTIVFRFQRGEWLGYKEVFVPRVADATKTTTTKITTIKTTSTKTTKPTTATTESGTINVSSDGNSGSTRLEIGLIYGLIFGGLAVVCILVVLLILILKYVQMTRREKDKGSNKRELEREEFRRMSFRRAASTSSGSSVKKTSPSISRGSTGTNN